MRYAGLILAAGRGSRFAAAGGSGPSKLVAPYRGGTLVRHVAEVVLASRVAATVVVTGHARAAVEAALAGLPVALTYNADHAAGLSTSLRCGLAAVAPDADGAAVVLADMPGVTPAIVNALIARAEACPDAQAVVPTHGGRRGNPVLVTRALFDRLATLSGDRGARLLLDDPSVRVEMVEQPEGILADIDHPDDLARAEGVTHTAARLPRAPLCL